MHVDELKIKRYDGYLLEDRVIRCSSTEYKDGHFHYIPERVQQYIADHFLYIEEHLERKLSEKRFIHSKQTGNIARRLARNISFSGKKAYFAGIMHDLAKE